MAIDRNAQEVQVVLDSVRLMGTILSVGVGEGRRRWRSSPDLYATRAISSSSSNAGEILVGQQSISEVIVVRSISCELQCSSSRRPVEVVCDCSKPQGMCRLHFGIRYECSTPVAPRGIHERGTVHFTNVTLHLAKEADRDVQKSCSSQLMAALFKVGTQRPNRTSHRVGLSRDERQVSADLVECPRPRHVATRARLRCSGRRMPAKGIHV